MGAAQVDQWQRTCMPMQEMRCSSIPGLGRSLEEEMATHSSILAEKSHGQCGGLEPMGLQRVGHNRAHTRKTFEELLYTR